jgi:hypothetical protein
MRLCRSPPGSSRGSVQPPLSRRNRKVSPTSSFNRRRGGWPVRVAATVWSVAARCQTMRLSRGTSPRRRWPARRHGYRKGLPRRPGPGRSPLLFTGTNNAWERAIPQASGRGDRLFDPTRLREADNGCSTGTKSASERPGESLGPGHLG